MTFLIIWRTIAFLVGLGLVIYGTAEEETFPFAVGLGLLGSVFFRTLFELGTVMDALSCPGPNPLLEVEGWTSVPRPPGPRDGWTTPWSPALLGQSQYGSYA